MQEHERMVIHRGGDVLGNTQHRTQQNNGNRTETVVKYNRIKGSAKER